MKQKEFPSADEKSLREKEDVLKALLHTLPVGISILDKAGFPLYTNTALKTILQLSREELDNKKYQERKYLRADGSEMPPGEFPSTRVFKEGKAIRDVEIGILTETGDEIWTSVSAIPFQHGDWCVLLTTTDITQQKEFELAVKKHAADLAERVKELNCLYGIAQLVEQPNITFQEILQGTVELIPPSWHYPPETSARIVYEGKEFLSPNFQTSSQRLHKPIYAHEEICGTLEVFLNKDIAADQSPFLREEENLLYLIAERLGRISERFKAEKRLIELATTDPLTGLYNRRHFFDLARHEIARTQRYHRPLSCIMLDIDNFKGINDSYGHLIGDLVIKNMVQRCQQAIREVDIFARYGGDEFILLLPEADQRRAKQLAQRLAKAFRNNPLQIKERAINISISQGLASMKSDQGLSLDTLLTRADEALYNAKRSGKNQIAIWKKHT